jgi:uncharacterized protein
MPDPTAESDDPFEFPCRFPIKAVGRAQDGFEAVVVDIVRRHAPTLDVAEVTLRESSGGKWLAVTVVIEAESRSQLDAIYRDLTDHDLVVWAI